MTQEWRQWWERYWGWMLIAAAIAASLIYYADVRDREAKSACQAEYNNTFAQVVTLRAESSGARQSAVDDVILGVGKIVVNPPTTAKEQVKAAKDYQALFQRYAEAVKETDAVRAANPYPRFPNCAV